MEKGNNYTIICLSLPLAAVVALSAIVALTSPGFYAAETLNWQLQSEGQDLADLFLVTPALLITSLLAYRQRKAAILVWAGINAYLLYTFLIYCFAVHFNPLFPVYCLALGLSFFSLIWFMVSPLQQPAVFSFSGVPRRFTSIYFIIISVVFYLLWLSEIVPAILHGNIPASTTDTGLFTNPVHVIDLAVVLPGIFIAAVFLWKKQRIGYMLAPAILSFFILMDCTIAALILLMKGKGLEGNSGISIIMLLLAILSSVNLARYIRKIK